MSRKSLRWIPALLAPVLVAGSVIGFSVQATAATDLPDKSAAQILQLINTNPNIAFSGRIVKKAAMGLPPMNIVPDVSESMIEQMKKQMPEEMADFIPKASAQGELALALEFFAGTHIANIYVDGPTKARLQVLDLLSERNYIRNGKDLWAYDASKAIAQHSVIDESEVNKAQGQALALFNANSTKLPFDVTSPASVADYVLAQANVDSVITVGADAKIAGRGVYQLTITPRSNETLVQSATLSIDAATGLPLAARITAVGSDSPAFEVAFETISFARPAASNFDFTPPAGATVVEVALPTEAELRAKAELAQRGSTQSLPTEDEIRAEALALKAQGWGAVAKVRGDQVPAEIAALIAENSLYLELTKPVAGGRVFTSTLLNIFIADSGDIYAGSVTVERLLKAATTK
jgi:outer membrane lipoprotein-sorting protein